MFDGSISCVSDSGDEIVVFGVEMHRKRTVDDAAVDMDSEIDLHDIVVLQHFKA